MSLNIPTPGATTSSIIPATTAASVAGAIETASVTSSASSVSEQREPDYSSKTECCFCFVNCFSFGGVVFPGIFSVICCSWYLLLDCCFSSYANNKIFLFSSLNNYHNNYHNSHSCTLDFHFSTRAFWTLPFHTKGIFTANRILLF